MSTCTGMKGTWQEQQEGQDWDSLKLPHSILLMSRQPAHAALQPREKWVFQHRKHSSHSRNQLYLTHIKVYVREVSWAPANAKNAQIALSDWKAVAGSRNTSTQLEVKSKRRFLGGTHCQFIHKQTVRPLVSVHNPVLLSCSHIKFYFKVWILPLWPEKKKVIYKKKNIQSVILFIHFPFQSGSVQESLNLLLYSYIFSG